MLGWIVFSIIIGIWADKRGREGVVWFFISICISALLAGIILFVLPDLKKQANTERSKLKLSSADFIINIEQLYQLCQKEIMTDAEYHLKKDKLIVGLSYRIIDETPEAFLASFIPLLDKGIVSTEDIQKIKTIIYKAQPLYITNINKEYRYEDLNNSNNQKQYCMYCGKQLPSNVNLCPICEK